MQAQSLTHSWTLDRDIKGLCRRPVVRVHGSSCCSRQTSATPLFYRSLLISLYPQQYPFIRTALLTNTHKLVHTYPSSKGAIYKIMVPGCQCVSLFELAFALDLDMMNWGDDSTKIFYLVIVYFSTKSVCDLFFCGTQKKMFWTVLCSNNESHSGSMMFGC